jgi:hypothetical protein
LGTTILDTLAAFAIARWTQRGETRLGVDLTWAALNSLVLALARSSCAATSSDTCLSPSPHRLSSRQESVNSLLCEGVFRQAGDE